MASASLCAAALGVRLTFALRVILRASNPPVRARRLTSFARHSATELRKAIRAFHLENLIMKLDHVCIAVRSIDAAVARLAPLLGYVPRTGRVTNTRQKVNVIFLSKQGSLDLKLIEPAGDDSPLWASLRKGEGLHHLCFRTDDTEATLAHLSKRGLRTLSPPAPGEAFDDHLIAFGYAGFGLNIELIDTDDRRSPLKNSPSTTQSDQAAG